MLRLTLDPLLSGLGIILANIIRDPQKASASSDMGLIEPLLRLVDRVAENKTAKRMDGARATCADLESRAKSALEEANARICAIAEKTRVSESHQVEKALLGSIYEPLELNVEADLNV